MIDVCFEKNHVDRGNLIDRMKMFVRCQQRYSVKGHGVYIPGFVGETVSVTATQLCPWKSAHRQDTDEQAGCVLIKLYL